MTDADVKELLLRAQATADASIQSHESLDEAVHHIGVTLALLVCGAAAARRGGKDHAKALLGRETRFILDAIPALMPGMEDAVSRMEN